MKYMQGDTRGAVRLVLRVEGLCVVVGALLAYSSMGYDWGLFAILFFAPDFAFFAYLAGSTAGAITYNATHSYVGAILCLAIGFLATNPALLPIGIIWCAHIGLDRSLGYGLKYSTGFEYTHLGLIGRMARLAKGSAPTVAAENDTPST